MRYSTTPVPADTASWWSTATAVSGLPTPSPAGVTDQISVSGLVIGQSYHFLMRAADEVPNWSPFSNVWREDVGSDVAESGTTAVLDCWTEPNPFGDRTRVCFSIPRAGIAALSIYDPNGRHVASLLEGPVRAGTHVFLWKPAGMASGVYFLRLEADGRTLTRRIILLR